jgi:hypothetical protein
VKGLFYKGFWVKTACTMWFFCGEFVVDCVVDDGRFLRGEEYANFFGFIF